MRELKITAAVLMAAGLLVATTPRDEESTQLTSQSQAGAQVRTDGTGATGSAFGAGEDPGEGAGASPANGASDDSSIETRGPSDSGTSPTNSAGGVQARGITDDKITIGIGWFDINAYAAVLAPDADRQGGTTRDAADAVVRWMNERGGIAGRQIVPIYHEYPLQDVLGSASTRNTREQAMCSDFTEDHQAFAAIPWISSMGTFYECAAQHNLVTIATSFSEGLVDQSTYDRIGHVWYSPRGLLLDRREEMFVNQLDRRGFFPSGVKVGVILRDLPPTRGAADRSLLPALAARGVKDVEIAYYSEITTDWNNIILRFRGAGVTHVVWGSGSSSFIAAGQFMTASENQQYRPYNALGSDHGIAGQTLVTPAAQRERIVAVGWSPTDVGDDAYEVEAPINDTDATCRQVKKETGSDLAQTLFVPYCDGLFFIKRVLEASPELTPEGFRRTVEGPSFTFSAAGGWATAFPGGRHDGGSAVRDIIYKPDCECFVFEGPTRDIG